MSAAKNASENCNAAKLDKALLNVNLSDCQSYKEVLISHAEFFWGMFFGVVV